MLTKKGRRILGCDTLCPLVWNNIDILQDSSLAPCCYFDKHTRFKVSDDKDLVSSFHDNDLIKKVKTSMLNNERPKECSFCYECESEGVVSPRLVAKDLYPDFKVPEKDVEVDGLHLRLSNNCDLACRNCNAFQSTGWNKDHIKLNPGSKPLILNIFKGRKVDESFKNLLSNVLNLYLSGGEPLLDTNIYEVLDVYTSGRGKDGLLQIQTNLARTNILSSKEFNLIKDHPNSTLFVSIDAIGKQAEYLRKGLKWDVFENNLNELLKLTSEVNICLAITISIHNVFSVLDVFQYFVTKDKLDSVDIEINFVDEPKSLNPRNLPENVKTKVHEKYIEYINRLESKTHRKKVEQGLTRILNFLKLDPKAEMFDFFLYSNKIDSVRDENTLEIFPYLKKFNQL